MGAAAKSGAAFVPALTRVLADEQPQIREKAAQSLSLVAPKDSQTVRTLSAAFATETDRRVKEAIGLALQQRCGRSPGLDFTLKRVEARMLILASSNPLDPVTAEKAASYEFVGHAVSSVELANDGKTLRLTCDAPFNWGEQAVLRFPGVITVDGISTKAELPIALSPGAPNRGDALYECLVGGVSSEDDPEKALTQPTLNETDLQPVAGKDWTLARRSRRG